MNEKTITITKEQFAEATHRASDIFMSIGKEADNKDPMAMAVMGMQNMMFSSLIAKVLFEESEDK